MFCFVLFCLFYFRNRGDNLSPYYHPLDPSLRYLSCSLHMKGTCAPPSGKDLHAWKHARILERIGIVGEDRPLLHDILNVFETQAQQILGIHSSDAYSYCIPTRWLPQLSGFRQRLYLCLDLALKTSNV